ncbi:MAG TPA: gamma carbonic anhydrase family protein [Acidimicrobiia bacterium]|jgi:carbonic anhydrase/acetyltransferase-like protein (isoleucine patch superfamily)|nr:gamma carbonic anhydrase family protein [Acidimicrobiia bacterium]
MLREPTIDPAAFVAPTAQLHGNVIVQRGAVIMFGAVLRAEMEAITIGVESNVQDNAVFHTDTGYPVRIGDRVTVGHAAVVHGAKVADHCLVGIGSIMLNGSSLGEGAWLAAGSMLTPGKEIPPWTLAAGSPAKPLRDLRPEEIRSQDEGVGHYLDFADLYRVRFGLNPEPQQL